MLARILIARREVEDDMRSIETEPCTRRKGRPHILADLDANAHLSTLKDDISPDGYRVGPHLHRLIL